MSEEIDDPLPPEAALALAWSPPEVRAPLSMALRLDRRLARIVGRTREPMLGQMRLAWWRDALGQPLAGRPQGDAVLDGLGAHWAGREAALIALVDAWEVMLAAARLDADEIERFAAGRAAFFPALGGGNGAAAAAGRCWALADAAAGVSDPDERARLVAAGLAAAAEMRGRLPPAQRGLCVLAALARRALHRGGRPLMEGRGAPFTALRAAIFRA